MSKIKDLTIDKEDDDDEDAEMDNLDLDMTNSEKYNQIVQDTQKKTEKKEIITKLIVSKLTFYGMFMVLLDKGSFVGKK
jgi:hypothetical protein